MRERRRFGLVLGQGGRRRRLVVHRRPQEKKVTAKSTPKRIVAFTGTAAALVDFGLDKEIVGVFGETKDKDGKAVAQAGDLNVGKVTVLGNAWGEFSIEKYAALRPELLITHMFNQGALWYVPDESKDKILGLAPSVAVTTARVPMTEPIKRYAELAESLGADLKAKKVTDAKARFEAAAETLRKAAKASGGLKVLAASGSADLLYASNPKSNSDLMYFAELGVDIVVPDKLDDGGYFESLSWENAGKYKADLILLDNRDSALQPKALAAKPAWAELPAVKAGQITPWDSVPRFSYAGAAPSSKTSPRPYRAPRRSAESHDKRHRRRSVPLLRRTRRPHRTPRPLHGEDHLRRGAVARVRRGGGRDQSFSLFLPQPGQSAPVLPDSEGEGWLAQWRAMDPAVRAVMRSYTVREHRREPAEVDVDFALHGTETRAAAAAAGPAARWASRAARGDRAVLLGPSRRREQERRLPAAARHRLGADRRRRDRAAGGRRHHGLAADRCPGQGLDRGPARTGHPGPDHRGRRRHHLAGPRPRPRPPAPASCPTPYGPPCCPRARRTPGSRASPAR
ncbi:hypothetical protein GCM10020000_37130 [Streptomyces olivoverticillatus]